MKEYKLEMVNGYPLMVRKEGVFLIDTGSPKSLSFSLSYLPLEIDGRTIDLLPYPPYSDEVMSLSFHGKIQGIISGKDLSSFDVVTIHKKNQRITFNGAPKHSGTELDLSPNSLYTVKVNSLNDVAYLNTRAHVLLINDQNAIKGCTLCGSALEPFGDRTVIEMKEYKVPFSFEGKEIKTTGLLIPLKYKRCYPHRNFFSLDLVSEEYYSFDFKDGKICFK